MIQIQHLTKRFAAAGATVVALNDINLEIQDGDIYGIIGMSGAGKSTLVRCINMLERPDEGKVIVNGREMMQLSPAELRDARREITMIFQQFNLLMQRTCLKNICFPMELAGVPKDKATARARELLELVGLPDKADAYPAQLSGGEQQRTALAKVMLTEPKILLLDEPTKGMDSFFKQKFARVLKRLQTEGVTVVMVSHDVEFCARYADLTGMFFDGSIVTVNTPEKFFARNSFYTTAANRMSRHIFQNAVNVEDVIDLCRKNR